MAADPHLWFRWNTAMGLRSTIASGYREAAERAVADGLGWVDGDVLVPLLPPRLRHHSSYASEEHFRVARTTLWALERGVTPRVDRIATATEVRPPHVVLSLEVLIDDGLITIKRGRVAAAVTPPRRREPLDREWLHALPVPAAAKPAPAPAPAPVPVPVQKPTPAPVPVQKPTPAPVPVQKPTPAPAPPQPKPEPKPEPQPKPAPKPPARVNSRTMAAASAKPAAAAIADENDEDSQTLLRRLVHAAEVSAGIAAAPTRVRTPVGVSPLLDCQLRLCVVLAGAGRPLLRSDISRLYLSRDQQPWLVPALVDGVRRGAFRMTGGRGRSGKGARFALDDPTVFNVSIEEVRAAVDAQQADRERRRKLGSDALAAG